MHHDSTTHTVTPNEDNSLVLLYNDEDSYYYQEFKSREEIDIFITEVEKARDKVFPLDRVE